MRRIYLIILFLLSGIFYFSCSNNEIINALNDITSNEITAKDRLDSAVAQAQRKYSSNVKLILIFGKNVEFGGVTNGRADISLYSGITDPNLIGAWLYFFKKPGTDTLAIYTPNPIPGARNCIELTSIYNFNTLLNLITDTSARNIVSGCLTSINNSDFYIKTNLDSLMDSDASMLISNSSDPVIKFNSSFIPTASHFNGGAFFTRGYGKSVNMFLIPALGTLNLPLFIQDLIGFPDDLWIVNYKKLDSVSTDYVNFIVGTTVKSDQIMSIPFYNVSSKAINLSKY
jgi:hypothetical protein